MQNKVINISENGLTKLALDHLEMLSITVSKGVTASLLIEYSDCNELERTINLEDGAKLNILQINNNKASSINEEVHLASNSEIVSGYYELNNNDVDLVTRYHFDGAMSQAKIISSCVTNQNNKNIDIECVHHVGNTTSDMENFAISNDGAKYTIRACGTIEKGSVQAKSFQNTKVLTTSENQTSSVTPLLLIDENDVMASHANSVGAMNDEHLYYLMSRGLNRQQATGLLTLSYLLPLSNIIDDENIKDEITNKIRNQVGL